MPGRENVRDGEKDLLYRRSFYLIVCLPPDSASLLAGPRNSSFAWLCPIFTKSYQLTYYSARKKKKKASIRQGR